MPRRCTVCDHPDRQEVEKLLVRGEPLRNVAERFSLSTTAVYRHKDNHLPAKLVKARDAETVAEADRLMGDVVEHADDVLSEVRHLHRRANAILDRAEAAENDATSLKAIREARLTLELLARLLGELKDGPTVNVHIAPQWIELRTTILHVLEPYPEARTALAAAVGEGTGHAGG